MRIAEKNEIVKMLTSNIMAEKASKSLRFITKHNAIRRARFCT